MSAFGIPNPAAAAAVSAAQHAVTAGAKPGVAKASAKPAGHKRSEDELILAPSNVEGREALRAIAENSQEEAHEDHQEHEQPQKPRKPLDLEA